MGRAGLLVSALGLVAASATAPAVIDSSGGPAVGPGGIGAAFPAGALDAPATVSITTLEVPVAFTNSVMRLGIYQITGVYPAAIRIALSPPTPPTAPVEVEVPLPESWTRLMESTDSIEFFVRGVVPSGQGLPDEGFTEYHILQTSYDAASRTARTQVPAIQWAQDGAVILVIVTIPGNF